MVWEVRFSTPWGEGVDRAVQNWGAGGGGVGIRAQLTEALISHYKLWCQRHEIVFLTFENGQCFPAKYMAEDIFLNPLDALIPKIPSPPPPRFFVIFCGIRVRVTCGAWGSVWVGSLVGRQLSPFWVGVGV